MKAVWIPAARRLLRCRSAQLGCRSARRISLSSDNDLKLLVFAASMQAESLNRRLAALVNSVLHDYGADTDFASFEEFNVPAYNGDVETNDGIPQGAQEFKGRLDACDGFVICSPEYNGSMPGNLKNLIDWTSRFKQQPFDGVHGLLLSASPAMTGGNRGLWALRVPLEILGARVFPGMFSLAVAHKAFDGDDIADEALRERLDKMIQAFLELAQAVKSYAESSSN